MAGIFVYMKQLFIHIPKTAGQSIFSSLNDKWNYVEHAKHDPLFLLERNNDTSQAFKFAVVRNPFRRTFSYYKHFNSVNGIECKFDEFINFIKNNIPFPKTKMIPYSQSFYCLNCNGDIGLDKIYKFENLHELEEDLNIKIPHKNKGIYHESEYFNSYNSFEKDFVRDYYASDFDNFNYSLDFV